MWMMFSHAAVLAFEPPKWLEIRAKSICQDLSILSHPHSRSLDVSGKTHLLKGTFKGW